MALQVSFKSKQIIDRSTQSQDFLTLLLKNRKIKKEELKDFLNPPNPVHFPPQDFGLNPSHLELAFTRINQAIKKQENILIYGDYDVDGITATAVLWQALHQKKAKVIPFIPDREADGYGLKAKSFFRIQQEKGINFSLLITVDNGIVAHQEIEAIIATGVDVIVSDHHVATTPLPLKTIVLHSTLVSGCTLSWLLARHFDPHSDLGLVALGAVADCLPLVGINRSLVVHGLLSLRLNPSPGIKKLITLSGAKQDSLSTYDLAFLIAPRINAVGRLSDPTDALRLLCSSNLAQATKYAATLNQYNQDRQSLQQESLDLALKQVNKKNRLIFVSDASFHPGIIGLIAGRLTEKYGLPSIAISLNGDVCKGSCRSVSKLNIIETLRELKDLFVDLGGHSQAAGFSIKKSNINKLKKQLISLVNLKLKDEDLSPTTEVDAPMKLNAVTLKNINLTKKLEPFGIGNSEPLFYFENVKVISKRLLGQNGDHLKLKLDDPDTPKVEYLAADAIAFKKGDLDSQIKVGDLISLVAKIDTNTWNGTTTPQLIVKEIVLPADSP